MIDKLTNRTSSYKLVKASRLDRNGDVVIWLSFLFRGLPREKWCCPFLELIIEI